VAQTRINYRVPFGFDAMGRTAQPADPAGHVRDLIRQVLLVRPGERVNRPTYGSGLLDLPFENNRVELIATIGAAAQGELLRWLSDLIEVPDVKVEANESTLTITVSFRIRRTGEQGKAVVERPRPSTPGSLPTAEYRDS
jgi:phage baseplate assembly protein W